MYSPSNIVRVCKRKKLELLGPVVWNRLMISVLNILIGKLQRKKSVERTRHRWKVNNNCISKKQGVRMSIEINENNIWFTVGPMWERLWPSDSVTVKEHSEGLPWSYRRSGYKKKTCIFYRTNSSDNEFPSYWLPSLLVYRFVALSSNGFWLIWYSDSSVCPYIKIIPYLTC